MRGGYLRDHVPPYTDADLKAEFADRYDLRDPSETGTGQWSARRVGRPDAIEVTADTAGELAARLRRRQ